MATFTLNIAGTISALIKSLGGNGAADSGKLATFNTEGQIRCSVENSTTGALVAESSGSGYAGYFSASGNGTALRVVHGGAGAGIEVTADNGYATSLISSADIPLSVQRVNSTGDGSGRLAEFAATISRTVEMYVGFDGGLGWRALGTGAQTTANNLPTFGAANKGLVPLSGGSADEFLSADATFKVIGSQQIANGSDVSGASIQDAINALNTADGNHDSSIAALITATNTNTSDISALQSDVAGKANTSHTHAISDVTGLQTALDGKASSVIGTVVQLATYAGGSQANSTTSLTTPTDTAMTLAVGVWDVYYAITYNAAVTTTGAHFTLGASGGLVASNIIGSCLYTTGTGDADNSIIAAFDGGNAVASSRVTTGNGAVIMATLVVTTGGDVVVRFRSEVGASAITITNVTGFALRKG